MVGGSLTREEIQDILTIANEVAEHTRAGNVLCTDGEQFLCFWGYMYVPLSHYIVWGTKKLCTREGYRLYAVVLKCWLPDVCGGFT